MKNLKITGKKIEFETNTGDTIRGEYYVRESRIYFIAKTAYELAKMIDNGQELRKAIRETAIII